MSVPLISSLSRVVITLRRFGGSDSQHDYNDTWSFDISTRKWTELHCTGSIPSPRSGHAAVLIDDVMYVFGGFTMDKNYLDDLVALQLSSEWFSVLRVYIALFRFEMQRSGGLNFSTWGQIHIGGHVIPWLLTGHVPFYLEDGQKVHRRMRFPLFTFLTQVCTFFCHLIWTVSKTENTEHIKYPETDPNAVSPIKKTTQLAWKSSAGSPTQEQPQHPTSSSSEAHSASLLRKATPAVLGGPASPQIIHEGDVSEASIGYHANFAAPYSSSEGDVARLELEQQLWVSLAAQAERDQRIVQLTDELSLKSALLEQAEANPTEAAKRAGLELREQSDRLLMQSSRVKQRDVELRDMQAKPLSRDQQIEQYEKELANVRVKLEARESELEAVRLRLADAEKGWIKSKAEADTLRAQIAAGFVNRDEDQVIRRLMERVRDIEAQMASMRWNDKNIEAMECRNEG
jgi:hypothetical protein